VVTSDAGDGERWVRVVDARVLRAEDAESEKIGKAAFMGGLAGMRIASDGQLVDIDRDVFAREAASLGERAPAVQAVVLGGARALWDAWHASWGGLPVDGVLDPAAFAFPVERKVDLAYGQVHFRAEVGETAMAESVARVSDDDPAGQLRDGLDDMVLSSVRIGAAVTLDLRTFQPLSVSTRTQLTGQLGDTVVAADVETTYAFSWAPAR
jgi:hypothetical protein